jgi:hypothetical protein
MLIHGVVILSIMHADLEVAVVNIINHLSPKKIHLEIYGVIIIEPFLYSYFIRRNYYLI